jgi:cysteine-rich repeat protein
MAVEKQALLGADNFRFSNQRNPQCTQNPPESGRRNECDQAHPAIAGRRVSSINRHSRKFPITVPVSHPAPLLLCLFILVCPAPAAAIESNPAAKSTAEQESQPYRGRLKPGALGSASARNIKPARTKSESRSIDGLAKAANGANAVENPPPICFGHGSLNSIDFTDWEAGLGTWTVGTESVANPPTFNTEDWKVVGSLPDDRPGNAAFVANLDSGNCITEDETGMLFLQSDTIELPLDAVVPRVAFDHWFRTEPYWDGGNLKLSVNGEPFKLVPTTAIEFNTYESRLNSIVESNTNPLANQPAYTWVSNGDQGFWEEVRVNLHGLAQAGDRIRFRFEFGIDGCDGVIGWYVDDIRFYSCSEELPPSDCGNGYLDQEEPCDDGNNLNGDGCSNVCQVEQGWICSEPLPPMEIPDGGFEAGTPSAFWTEASTNFGTPICDEPGCGLGTGSGPASGNYWAWFGGSESYEESSLQQSVTIPLLTSALRFELEVSFCDSNSDYLEIRLDGVQRFFINGSSPLCGSAEYSTQEIAIHPLANGESHLLEFHAETFANNQDVTNFFVDDVFMVGRQSACKLAIFEDGFESN